MLVFGCLIPAFSLFASRSSFPLAVFLLFISFVSNAAGHLPGPRASRDPAIPPE